MSRRCTGILACVSGLLLFTWLAVEVALGHALGFDAPVRAYVHQFASPGLTAAMRLATALGPGVFFWVSAACVVVVLLYLRRNRDAARLLITLAGAGLLDMSLKAGFHRPRPAPFFDTPLPDSYSFPSGHALFSLCFYGSLAVLLRARARRPATRVAIGLLAIALIALIGLSRIYLGVHYPSDVIAGYAVALVWVLTVWDSDTKTATGKTGNSLENRGQASASQALFARGRCSLSPIFIPAGVAHTHGCLSPIFRLLQRVIPCV